MRWTFAVILSSVVVYMWGFFFFAFSGLTEKAVLKVEDDLLTGEVLKEHFPQNGVYFFPNSSENEQEMDQRYKAGPVAIIHMVNVDGREMMDSGIMISGFCHIMLTSIFLCMLLGLVNAGLSGWIARVGFFVFVGFLIAFYSEVGVAVWWQISWTWQLINALHDWVAISLAGLIIATIAPYPKK